MKTLEQWAEHYDIYEMEGTGSGCSYNNLVEWCRPAWEYQQKRIDKIKSKFTCYEAALMEIAKYRNSRGGQIALETLKKIQPKDKGGRRITKASTLKKLNGTWGALDSSPLCQT